MTMKREEVIRDENSKDEESQRDLRISRVGINVMS